MLSVNIYILLLLVVTLMVAVASNDGFVPAMQNVYGFLVASLRLMLLMLLVMMHVSICIDYKKVSAMTTISPALIVCLTKERRPSINN